MATAPGTAKAGAPKRMPRCTRSACAECARATGESTVAVNDNADVDSAVAAAPGTAKAAASATPANNDNYGLADGSAGDRQQTLSE